jgi:hypothetical protein
MRSQLSMRSTNPFIVLPLSFILVAIATYSTGKLSGHPHLNVNNEQVLPVEVCTLTMSSTIMPFTLQSNRTSRIFFAKRLGSIAYRVLIAVDKIDGSSTVDLAVRELACKT